MNIETIPVTIHNSSILQREAAENVYWELECDDNGLPSPSDDPAFDRQLWLHRVLVKWGSCGMTAVEAKREGYTQRRIATAFFGPPVFFPGLSALPASDPSPDAIVLASIYLDMPFMNLYVEHELVEATIREVRARGVKAIEAYASRESDVEDESLRIDDGESYRQPTLHAKFPTGRTLRLPRQGNAHPLESTNGEEPDRPLTSTIYQLASIRPAELNMVTKSRPRARDAQTLLISPHHEHVNRWRCLSEAPLVQENVLQDQGFKLIDDHPVFPRYRREIPDPGSPFGVDP